jgi:V/A-type H+-transporting ATPase subunit F
MDISVIGAKDTILGFKALGMSVFKVNNYVEAEKKLEEIKANFAIIFITEEIAKNILTTIEKIDQEFLPSIVIIPDITDNDETARLRIKNTVKTALGVDLYDFEN